MKNSFQVIVILILSILLTIFVLNLNKTTTINVLFKAENPGKFQIFWRNASENFSENKSQNLILQKSEDYTNTVFRIPTQDIFEIRLDPIDRPGTVEIHSLSLTQGLWRRSYNSSELSKISSALHQITNLEILDSNIKFDSIGSDPQILVRLNPIPKWNLILVSLISLLLMLLACKLKLRKPPGSHYIRSAKCKLNFHFSIIIFLFFGFGVAITFKLHGSSIHSWYHLYPSLFWKHEKPLIGEARSVRSDEWLVHTPAIISQSKNNPEFSTSNISFGSGKAPMLMGLPTKHITTAFRPQYWGFFIFEIERAYAWWWAYRVFACILGVYLLTNFLVRGNNFLAFTASIWFFFSAFVQWWLSSGVPELVASFSLSLFCLLSLATRSERLPILLYGLGLLLFGLSFSLQIYPPFQIPLIWLGLAITFGICLSKSFQKKIRTHLKFKIAVITIVALAASFLILTYLISIKETALAISQTAYPGERVESGGNFGISRLFSGFAGLAMSQANFPNSYGNISETSSFFFIWPIALICLFLSGRFKLRSQTLPLVIFLISFSLYILVGWPKFLSNITLMKMVPSGRALIALGLGGIIFCMMTLGAISRRSKLQIYLGIISIIPFCFLHYYKTESDIGTFFNFPEYMIGLTTLLLLCIPFIFKKPYAFCVVTIALVLSSAASVNPVVRGLAPLLDNKVSRAINRLPDSLRNGKWIIFGDFILPSLFKAAGVDVLNGAQYVPQLEFWDKLDLSKSNFGIYNRYAHFQFSPKTSGQAEMNLVQTDLVNIVIDPCHPSLSEAGISRMVLPSGLNPSCLDKVETILDKEGIGIYKRKDR